MKISPLLSTLVLTLCVAAAPASAATAPSPSALTVKAGISVESNAAVGQTGVALGADYVFHPASVLEPFNLSFYGDLLGKSGGVGVAIRNGGPAYAGAGVGVYSVSLTTGGVCAVTPSNCAQPTYTATGFGGKIFAGFDIAPHTTLELGYHVLPKPGGINANTISAQVGLRF